MVDQSILDKIDKTFNATFKCNGTYSIDQNGHIDVDGSVEVTKNITRLPVTFSKITGSGRFLNCGLTTLIGFPPKIHNLTVSMNKITSLEGVPENIYGTFEIIHNRLTSLQHCPKFCSWMNASYNPIKSLDGLTPSVTDISVDFNRELPLLRLLKAPYFELRFDNPNEEVKILRILNKYEDHEVTRSEILICQRELIDAGFEGNARW